MFNFENIVVNEIGFIEDLMVENVGCGIVEVVV